MKKRVFLFFICNYIILFIFLSNKSSYAQFTNIVILMKAITYSKMLEYINNLEKNS